MQFLWRPFLAPSILVDPSSGAVNVSKGFQFLVANPRVGDNVTRCSFNVIAVGLYVISIYFRGNFNSNHQQLFHCILDDFNCGSLCILY